jgi:hypothetical protein
MLVPSANDVQLQFQLFYLYALKVLMKLNTSNADRYLSDPNELSELLNANPAHNLKSKSFPVSQPLQLC